ncbi:major capsid protein [Desulfotalea psychrophila]|uniref:Uncharacterized protein n=1 Tax=Desulfotalea psychrophila (strain LSv54 / DSM 12343) TaxID=177439 RepID=Q6AMW0_DESPS|nr:major capsid protein [Desulfotalea psychrophila]CAG36314.1 related to predicted protein of phage Felix 01 [Desulfotalea psychrophila LSv54]
MSDLIVNPFDDGGYDLATMTTAVNIIPNKYGRLRSMGLFAREPVQSRVIIVEEKNGHLTLLPSLPPGSPGTRAKNGKGKTRSFIIPHIPYDDVVRPSDIQDKREAGTSNPKTLETVMMQRLTGIRGSHAITEEHLMCGAIKGIILDADGSELYDLYKEFGITAKVIAFALGAEGGDVAAKCRQVVRHIEDNLLGEVMSGVHCICGEMFMDDLISDPSVEKFFLNHTKALQLAGIDEDPRKGFVFGGITFEEYRAKATDPSTGKARSFIGADDAHFFPVGTMNTFKIHDAPAEYMETVNTFGQPLYAKQVMSADGKKIDILSESNPLPICRRPGLLVKGTK